MLKITIHDKPECLQFQLEGRLIGPWVAELEQSWHTAASIRNGRRVIADLSDVTFIDDGGQALLKRLAGQGVEFRASDPMTVCILNNVKARLVSFKPVALALFLAVLVFTPAVLAQEVPVLRLTMNDAVHTALKQNPRIAIANLNIAEAQENAAITRSGLLPQIGLSASEAVHRANIEAQLGRRFPGFSQHIGPFWTVQAGPNFSIPIFDLTLLRRYQSSRHDIAEAEAQAVSVREQNVLLVISQYLSGLRAAADVQAARSRLDLAKALLDLSADLQKNGVGTRIDTVRADVQYHNERQRLIGSETQLQTSLFGLARLLNLDPKQRIELADAVSFFETPAYDAERSLDAAFQSRPEMRALEARIRALESNRQAARDQRLPRLSVTGGWAELGTSPGNAIPAYNYQLNLEVPLYTGGRIQSQTAISGIEMKKAGQERLELRNRIALEVKTAAAQLDAARSEVDVANGGVELSREGLEQARDRFRAGVANNIEVVTAQDELARANDNQIVALYRYNQARADLARATGRIGTLYAGAAPLP